MESKSSKIDLMKNREFFWLFLVSLIILIVVTSLPYYIAEQSAGEDYVFGGFLMNPLDGNSYLAKMYQGYQGDWKYTLPYTAELSEGAYIFEFYLFLGHIARITGSSLGALFHIVRMICAVIMLVALYHFIKVAVPDMAARPLAFILAVFGSGLGWVALLAGKVTSDFWVAEAYPFLSAFSNPHFSLGIGLTLILISPIVNWRKSLFQREWATPFLVFTLAIVYPFGVILVLILLGLMVFWEQYLRADRSLPRVYPWRFIFILIFGAPVLFYYLWAIFTDPMFSAWNSQNITPSPGIIDFIVSFSPIILFVMPALVMLLKQKLGNDRVIVFWFVVGTILLFFPWNLQRRFIYGLYIPIVIVGVMGIYSMLKNKRSLRRIGIALIVLSLPTNIIMLFSAGQGIVTLNESIYIHKDEERAFIWISNNTPENSVIIAAPDTGLFIPARTGRRVIYGHPFETISAMTQKDKLERFYRGDLSIENISPLLQGDYLFYGPREKELGNYTIPEGLELVFERGEVQVFRVKR